MHITSQSWHLIELHIWLRDPSITLINQWRRESKTPSIISWFLIQFLWEVTHILENKKLIWAIQIVHRNNFSSQINRSQTYFKSCTIWRKCIKPVPPVIIRSWQVHLTQVNVQSEVQTPAVPLDRCIGKNDIQYWAVRMQYSFYFDIRIVLAYIRIHKHIDKNKRILEYQIYYSNSIRYSNNWIFVCILTEQQWISEFFSTNAKRVI